VQDLTKRAVNSYEAIEDLVDEGTANRTIGSTLMNATSSRANTVLIIEFTQVTTYDMGKEGRKLSVIKLVDLAGSENAEQTVAIASAINKSMSALRNVISALADKGSGKLKKGQLIPYRDSKLTRLLQNALGGSSKTIMICAVSPASSNYEETLSTLRCADRAKKIMNHAEINEDPTEKLLNQLKRENERLKALLGGQGVATGGGPNGAGGSAVSEAERMRIVENHKKEIAAIEKALEEEEAAKQAAKQAAERAKEAARDEGLRRFRQEMDRIKTLIQTLESQLAGNDASLTVGDLSVVESHTRRGGDCLKEAVDYLSSKHTTQAGGVVR